MKANINTVLDILTGNPDGLTTTQIAEITGFSYSRVYGIVSAHRQVFIDRWTPNADGKCWVPVWCLAQVPDNAPMPTVKAFEYLRAQERRAA